MSFFINYYPKVFVEQAVRYLLILLGDKHDPCLDHPRLGHPWVGVAGIIVFNFFLFLQSMMFRIIVVIWIWEGHFLLDFRYSPGPMAKKWPVTEYVSPLLNFHPWVTSLVPFLVTYLFFIFRSAKIITLPK